MEEKSEECSLKTSNVHCSHPVHTYSGANRLYCYAYSFCEPQKLLTYESLARAGKQQNIGIMTKNEEMHFERLPLPCDLPQNELLGERVLLTKLTSIS